MTRRAASCDPPLSCGYHAEAIGLPIAAVALCAGRTAACRRSDILLLAGRASGAAVVSASGCLWALDDLRVVRKLPGAFEPARLFHHDHPDLCFLVRNRVRVAFAGLATGGHGR